ncbi:hypothetical protein QBC47DRAFT_78043, partial [Echria macrotheca]
VAFPPSHYRSIGLHYSRPVPLASRPLPHTPLLHLAFPFILGLSLILALVSIDPPIDNRGRLRPKVLRLRVYRMHRCRSAARSLCVASLSVSSLSVASPCVASFCVALCIGRLIRTLITTAEGILGRLLLRLLFPLRALSPAHPRQMGLYRCLFPTRARACEDRLAPQPRARLFRRLGIAELDIRGAYGVSLEVLPVLDIDDLAHEVAMAFRGVRLENSLDVGSVLLLAVLSALPARKVLDYNVQRTSRRSFLRVRLGRLEIRHVGRGRVGRKLDECSEVRSQLYSHDGREHVQLRGST